jgi:hypothetical protein
VRRLGGDLVVVHRWCLVHGVLRRRHCGRGRHRCFRGGLTARSLVATSMSVVGPSVVSVVAFVISVKGCALCLLSRPRCPCRAERRVRCRLRYFVSGDCRVRCRRRDVCSGPSVVSVVAAAMSVAGPTATSVVAFVVSVAGRALWSVVACAVSLSPSLYPCRAERSVFCRLRYFRVGLCAVSVVATAIFVRIARIRGGPRYPRGRNIRGGQI